MLRLDKMFKHTKEHTESSSEEGSSTSVAEPIVQRKSTSDIVERSSEEIGLSTDEALFPSIDKTDSEAPEAQSTEPAENAESPKQRKRPKIVVRANYPDQNQLKLF